MNSSRYNYECIVQNFSGYVLNKPLFAVENSVISVLLATLDIYRGTGDYTLFSAFFQDILGVLSKLGPLQLSYVWSRDEERRLILGISNSDIKPLFSKNFVNIGSNLDHDPFNIIHELVLSCKQSLLMVNTPNDKLPIILALVSMGIKSSRLSIILEAMLQMLLNMDTNVLIANSITNDTSKIIGAVDVLSDLSTYIKSNKSVHDNCVRKEEVSQLNLSGDNYPGDSNSSSEIHKVCVSFGKADHGKLGHGDTVVSCLFLLLNL